MKHDVAAKNGKTKFEETWEREPDRAWKHNVRLQISKMRE